MDGLAGSQERRKEAEWPGLEVTSEERKEAGGVMQDSRGCLQHQHMGEVVPIR